MLGLARMTVGIVVERRTSTSSWTDVAWRPVAVLAGAPDAEPWTPLGSEGGVETFYIGSGEIELYRTETENYLLNLSSRTPSIWVAFYPTGGEPPYALAAVTVDPAEGEALTEPGHGIVETVAMPDTVREVIASFISEHHVPRTFEKRKRDRADPEALSRRRPLGR